MNINCIIVDDEPISRDILRKYISDIPGMILSAECKDAFEATRHLAEHSTDLIFLDINMPRLSGVSFARSLTSSPLIIFTTAYPEYAVEGFELNAVDYLVKPFSFERFLKAANKAMAALSSSTPAPDDNAGILIKSEKKIYSVSLSDLLYIEGCGDYIKVRTEDRTLIVHDTMKGFISTLPPEIFMRVHKSYAVNLKKVEFLDGNTIHISGSTVQVSPQHREELIQRLQ
jgi:DNA-binding LytR/AlgR family response regulator